MVSPADQKKPLVGISSCLIGERVRYDGTDKCVAELVRSLGEKFEFIGFCPEIDIGLGVPRETIQLVEDGGRIRCIGTQSARLEVTAKLRNCADRQQYWHNEICGYIFKHRSPSCGLDQVEVFSAKTGEVVLIHRRGTGIYAQRLQDNFPDLPVADEERLADPRERQAFIERVLAYRDRMNHGVPMTTDKTAKHWWELQKKIEFLRQASSYPEATAEVEAIETQMSWVFLTDRFAYKLKKPVYLALVDFSTLEARYNSVQNELHLNQPLAPGVYLEVLPLVADRNNHFHLGTGNDMKHGEEVVDWLLKMKRLPRDRMLDQTLGKDHGFRERLHLAINMLTEFYRTAGPLRLTPDQYRERLRTRIEANFATLSLGGYGLDEAQLTAVYKTLLDWLDTRSALFDQRVRHGCIVDGHGDLRPEHICLTSPPVIIDRFELNPEERMLDPVDELSFLYMECEMMGHRDAGEFVFECYRQRSGDEYPTQIIRFFRSLGALTRTKFSAWHLDDPWVREKEKWRSKAAGYLKLAGIIND